MSTDLTSDLSALTSKVTEGMPDVLVRVLHEASDIRSLVKPGNAEDGPSEIHNQLLYNRAQIERLEFLTSRLVVLKSRTAQMVAKARNAYDDAYMKAATSPKIGFADYSSAKEKDAHFNANTIAETMELRKAEATHRDIDATWDMCRMLLRGAEGVQRDLELRMRLITLAGQLDR